MNTLEKRKIRGLKDLKKIDMEDNKMTDADLLAIYDISADYLNSLSYKEFIDLEFRGHNNERH